MPGKPDRLISRGKTKKLVHREEFIALAELGAEEGTFHEEESRVLTNLFRFRELRTSDIMTPRTVLYALPASMTAADSVAAGLHFSRIPLYGESHDDISGYVLKDQVLLWVAE